MTLGKITIDNRVKYIPSTNSSPSEKSHDHKPETVSNPGKQDKTNSQINKKFLRNEYAQGFRILKRIKNCCF